jgi:hypothetical protein
MGNQMHTVKNTQLETHIQYLLSSIKESMCNGEPFTTSTILSSMLMLDDRNKGLNTCHSISTYLHNKGYEVYNNPSPELWNMACLCSHHSNLLYPRKRFNLTQNLDFIILVKVCKIPDNIFPEELIHIPHPTLPSHIIQEFNQSKRKKKTTTLDIDNVL